MNSVQKRKASILKKRGLKAAKQTSYHNKREYNYILQAGDVFSKEKHTMNEKFKAVLANDITRGRKVDKRERKALGDMFKESFFDGHGLTYKNKDNIVVPNYTNIKARIRSVLDKEFTNIGPKLQLLSFVTIKYLVQKLSIKTCKQKQVFGKSFIELPTDIKAKKSLC